MLRITTVENPKVLTFQLEGRLEGEWVTLLINCWQCKLARLGRRQLCVDLQGLTFIDADGKALLTQMHKEGAAFIATDPMTKAIVAEIMAQ